jgi:type VI secretion system secreted protein VgrG
VESDLLDFLVQTKDLITTNRPLRLRLDCSTQLSEDMLLPQRVYGTESICGSLEYRILCVSTRAQLPLKEFIGLPAALDFVTDRGELRSVCGMITEIAAGDSDGGLASYQLVLRDALSIMDKRINTRVFRNKDEVEIVQLILDEWRLGNRVLAICFKHELADFFDTISYPKREFTMQHNESDGAFIRRLLKRRGIAWYFRADHGQKTLFHTMVLFNRADSVRQSAAGAIRYHRDSATEERDSITSWSAVRTLQPGSTATHSWDYRNPLGVHFMRATAQGEADQGSTGQWMAASLDDYQVLPPHAGDDHEDLFNLGQLRMQRHDYETKCFHAEGSVRDLCVGEYFTFESHPEIDSHAGAERDFTVTALQMTAQNNLPKALAARVERLFARNRWMRGQTHDAQLHKDLAGHVAEGGSRMHIQFTAVRRGIPIVPAYDVRIELPQPQMQSAVVVGPAGEEVHCDEMGRVKIRFPGTRAQDHTERGLAGTTDDDCDSAWVRVASNWAGNGPGHQTQCGTLGLPRIGSEVLVAFLGGDPDKPVIVGQLYNHHGVPPAFSTLDGLPGNRYLSGIKSREIKGGRANQLRLDDTAGEISAQLASDHGTSELNLGFLTQPKRQGTGVGRGEGAELRSDKAVSIRGARGVLISANAQPQAYGRLLAHDEISEVAELSRQVAGELSSLAEKHADDPIEGDEFARLIDRVSTWDSSQADRRSGEPMGTGESIVAIGAPGGTFVSSQKALGIGAQNSIDLAAGADIRAESGKNLLLRAMSGISGFALKMGIKLIAASGNIKIQSQNGDVEISSLKRIRLVAGESIEIQSPAIRLVAKGCQSDFGEGEIAHQSRGPHTIKSSEFRHYGGGDGNPNALKMPASDVTHDQQVLVTDLVTDEPIVGRMYRITVEDGQIFEGTTSEKGLTERFTTKMPFAEYKIELLN